MENAYRRVVKNWPERLLLGGSFCKSEPVMYKRRKQVVDITSDEDSRMRRNSINNGIVLPKGTERRCNTAKDTNFGSQMSPSSSNSRDEASHKLTDMNADDTFAIANESLSSQNYEATNKLTDMNANDAFVVLNEAMSLSSSNSRSDEVMNKLFQCISGKSADVHANAASGSPIVVVDNGNGRYAFPR